MIQGDWKTTTNKTKVFIPLADTGSCPNTSTGKAKTNGSEKKQSKRKTGKPTWLSAQEKQTTCSPFTYLVGPDHRFGWCLCRRQPSSGSGGWNARLEVSPLRSVRTLTATSWFPASPGEVGPIGSSVGNFVGGFSSQEVSWVRSLSSVLKISVLCECIRLTPLYAVHCMPMPFNMENTFSLFGKYSWMILLISNSSLFLCLHFPNLLVFGYWIGDVVPLILFFLSLHFWTLYGRIPQFHLLMLLCN